MSGLTLTLNPRTCVGANPLLIEWNVSASRGPGTRWWRMGAVHQRMVPVGCL